MPGTVIVGLQWGDEGKGKITDYFSSRADCVVRYQGGNNAGHTVVIGDDEYKLHLIPSGVLQRKKAVIGNGVVVDPEALLQEMAMLREQGIHPDIMISDRAHVIMPYHKLLDGAEESQLGARKIGTTKKGIGPCYTDKVARHGIRMGDLVHEEDFREKMERILPLKQKLFDAYGLGTIDAASIMQNYLTYGSKLREYVGDTVQYLNSIIDEREVLFEGAQGFLLDVDYGTYPYTTSSNPATGSVCTGAGVPPSKINRIVGIVKAYTTRVGMGPMPTEEHGRAGEHLAERGHEVGTTTGRKRRCGWLDLVALQYACTVNGVNEIALTKLDVLDGLSEIKVCTAYDVDGEQRETFPSSLKILEACTPVYETFEGWDGVRGKKSYDELPDNAKRYVDYVAERLKTPITIISTGPARDETIMV